MEGDGEDDDDGSEPAVTKRRMSQRSVLPLQWMHPAIGTILSLHDLLYFVVYSAHHSPFNVEIRSSLKKIEYAFSSCGYDYHTCYIREQRDLHPRAPPTRRTSRKWMKNNSPASESPPIHINSHESFPPGLITITY